MGEAGQNLIEEFSDCLDQIEFSAEAIMKVHLFNIAAGILMMVVGGVMLFKIRNQKNRDGKRIASGILIGLGAMATITHIIQALL